MRNLLISASLAALSTGAAHAQVYGAEEGGFYVEGGYSYLDITAKSEFDSVDDIGENVSALTARFGYQMTPVFSVEADASFGVDEGDFDFQGDREDIFEDDSGELGDVVRAAGTGDLGVDYLVGVYAKAEFPIAERFDVFGRVGYAFLEADINARVEDLDDDGIFDEPDDTDPVSIASGDDDGIAFGGGFSFDLTDTVAVRADYTRYEFDEAETNAGSVTIGFQF